MKNIVQNHRTLIIICRQVDGISDRFVTYDQLRDKCRALAIRLYTSLSLKTGDTIAVCFPNSIEFPTICLAGNEAGMVVTTVNPIYTAGKCNFDYTTTFYQCNC